MKSILIPLFVLSYLISFAQWEIGNYVDEFGEETEERFLHQTVSGTFSNSASTNAKCSYFIEHNKRRRGVMSFQSTHRQQQTQSVHTLLSTIRKKRC